VSPSIPRLVIVAYRPKPGKEAVLLAEVRDHHPFLRSEGLATDRAPTIMRAADGTIVEVFEWASQAAIEEAHDNPRVQAMWRRFSVCCDAVPLNQLPETAAMFAEFTPVVFDHTPMPEPPPSQRAE
jgi:quinol monooxygenase YgiN